MKYRVMEKCVGENDPVYYIQKREWSIWYYWVYVVGYMSKEEAIKTAKEYNQNGEVKTKIIWESK